MNLLSEFRIAFSDDLLKTLDFWSEHKEKIRKNTFASCVISAILGIVSFLVEFSGYGTFLLLSSVFVFLTYLFNSAGYIIAEKIPIDVPQDNNQETRAEYLDRITNKTSIKRANSPLFFVLPYILYLVCIIAALFMTTGVRLF